MRKDFPLAGKPSDLPGVAFTKPAPLEGGPFVTVAGGEDAIHREPRVRDAGEIIFMATVQDIEIRDSAGRAAQAAEELQDIRARKWS